MKLFKNSNDSLVLKEIEKLQPLNYNVFRWWRRWDSKSKPLPKNSPLWDKIINGDLDFSHYYWQAKYCDLELNSKYQSARTDQEFVENSRLDFQRKKRLWEDFEKDEFDKLKQLKKGFIEEFFIDEDQFKNEFEDFGFTLKDFYLYIEKNYKKRIKKLSKRGRPKKIKI